MSSIGQIVALCPTIQSGGPEAIHQLVWALNLNGARASILYYGDANGRIENGVMSSDDSSPNSAIEVLAA